MTTEDRNRADARFNHLSRAASEDKTGKAEREAELKAVTDNMARLKALRLAREAAEPARPAAASRKARAKPGKSEEKRPALSEWLAGRQSGGHRT